MNPDEEPKVRSIHRAVYAAAEPPSLFYYAYPTLVLEAEGALLGYTSYSIGPDELGLVLYGIDVAILPQFQRQGYGRRLADERLRYGRNVGCDRFLGATQEYNPAMRAILERQGFEELPMRLPNAFPRSTEAVVYGGAIPEDV